MGAQITSDFHASHHELSEIAMKANVRTAHRRKVLLVAMPDSIHVARWLVANRENNLEVLLFASSPMRKTHPLIEELTKPESSPVDGDQFYVRRHLLSFVLAIPLWILDRRFLFDGQLRGFLIARAIRRFKPDLLHTMESQQGGYSSVRALRWFSVDQKPKTLLTLFGSDLYWFSRFRYHQNRLRDLLSLTDYIQAECERDEALARELDFQGEFLPLLPVSAGIPAELIAPSADFDETPSRKVIAIKGYAGKWGQATKALDGLALLGDALGGYTIELYSCDRQVAKHATKVFRGSGVNVKKHPKFSLSHSQMLDLFRRSRIAIGFSRSDGLPASMLEAMSQGAFPVQTATACVDGWIKDSESGLVIEDLEAVSLSRRLKPLLEPEYRLAQAALRNSSTIISKYSDTAIKESAAQIYETILSNRNL